MPINRSMSITFEHATQQIIKAGNRLDALHLAPATSGNYSVRLDDKAMAITVSGAHKGMLEPAQIMKATLDGTPLEDKKPSDETLLHAGIYKIIPESGAILHSHSVAGTVLTRLMVGEEFLVLKDYEMLKAYPGVNTHSKTIRLPIFENSQDMTELQERVARVLENAPQLHAYLIRGHGLYGWGKDMREAERVIEATEFMLQCELQMKQIRSTAV